MKVQRGALPQDTAENDNFRIKRYIAKYTINPALTHGVAHEVGSLQAGKLADLAVLDTHLVDAGARDPRRLLEAKVLYTIVGGRVVHERSGPTSPATR